METCRKYNLSPTLLSKWKQRYLAKGTEGLKPAYKRVDPEVRALEEENERLKRIIARQALELEVKTELLKKTPIQPRKNEAGQPILRSCTSTLGF
jgi:transposase-like protein